MSILLELMYEDIKKHKVDLVAGGKGLKNRVRWVFPVESKDIIDFLQGGELIFISGLRIYNAGELLGLIEASHNKGISGVVVVLGKYIQNIDTKTIDYCNNHNIPLFSTPWGNNLTELMRSSTYKILEFEKTLDKSIEF